MSATMHLACLKDTGHILAALATTTAGGAPKLEAIVGADLSIASVRSTENSTAALGHARTLIPVSLMELKSVPYDENVVANPMFHAVDGGRVVRLPLLAATPTVTLSEFDVTLTGGTLATKGFCVVARAGEPAEQLRVQSGKFVDADGDGSADDLVLPLSILPDDTPAAIETSANYDIFVALAGLRPYWATQPVP